MNSFFAFDPHFKGGVYVAAGDTDGDGKADIVTGAGAGGGPQVSIFRGLDDTMLSSFFAFAPSYTGGVRVAAGDVNGDHRADILAASLNHVHAFDSQTLQQLDTVFAQDPMFYHDGVLIAGQS